MSVPQTRTNDEWLAAFREDADRSGAAVHELEDYLARVLRKTTPRLNDEERREIVQESLARIVSSLSSFRGDSAFPTWAGGIAVRTAFSEFRRRRARDAGSTAFDQVVIDVEALACPDQRTPDAHADRHDLLRALERAIATCLTDRQQRAIVAELRGIPTVEIARRLGTNQNALYKLTHDARRRLRDALFEAGYDAESVREGSTLAQTGNDEARR